jgi:hypothetical protein
MLRFGILRDTGHMVYLLGSLKSRGPFDVTSVQIPRTLADATQLVWYEAAGSDNVSGPKRIGLPRPLDVASALDATIWQERVLPAVAEHTR